MNSKKKTTYGVGNPGRGLGHAQIYAAGLNQLYIFFFIVLFNIK